jgi:hypothetical protein
LKKLLIIFIGVYLILFMGCKKDTAIEGPELIDLFGEFALLEPIRASVKTVNVPKPTATRLALSDGTFTGRASYLLSATTPLTASQVASDFKSNTDTLGQPYDSLFPSLNINLCPSGNCFTGPSVRPSNPLVVWKSDY